MKNILKSILLVSGLALWVACEKDEEKTILNTDAKVVSELSASSVVLEKTQSNTTALTVRWETKNFNISLGHSYSLEFVNGDRKKVLSVEHSPLEIKGKELNDYALAIGLAPEEATSIKVLVKALLSDQRSLVSEHSLTITPYPDALKPSEWSVVGAFTEGRWKEDRGIPFWNYEGDKLATYITLPEGNSEEREFKFVKNKKWDGSLGDDQNDGVVTAGDDNINKKVKTYLAGTYQVIFNPKNNNYQMKTPYSWGLVGDFNKWGNPFDDGTIVPDKPMTYDGNTNTWVLKDMVLTQEGGVKIRLNSSWSVNIGADADADTTNLEGATKAGGRNVKLPAGTYDIFFSFNAENKGTYKIVRK